MNSYVNKIMFFFSLSFVIVLVLIISSGYIMSNSTFSNQNIVVSNNNIKVSFASDSDSLESVHPLSYNEGIIKGSNIKLNIENTNDTKKHYQIKVKKTEDNEISFDKIYYQINNGTPALLSYNDGIIYENDIKAYESLDINVKVWIASELIENSDQGKRSNLKIIVE